MEGRRSAAVPSKDLNQDGPFAQLRTPFSGPSAPRNELSKVISLLSPYETLSPLSKASKPISNHVHEELVGQGQGIVTRGGQLHDTNRFRACQHPNYPFKIQQLPPGRSLKAT